MILKYLIKPLTCVGWKAIERTSQYCKLWWSWSTKRKTILSRDVSWKGKFIECCTSQWIQFNFLFLRWLGNLQIEQFQTKCWLNVYRRSFPKKMDFLVRLISWIKPGAYSNIKRFSALIKCTKRQIEEKIKSGSLLDANCNLHLGIWYFNFIHQYKLHSTEIIHESFLLTKNCLSSLDESDDSKLLSTLLKTLSEFISFKLTSNEKCKSEQTLFCCLLSEVFFIQRFFWHCRDVGILE